jgi:hypothetical protein
MVMFGGEQPGRYSEPKVATRPAPDNRVVGNN